MKTTALATVSIFLMVACLLASATVGARSACADFGDFSTPKTCRAQYPDGSPALFTPEASTDAPWYVVPLAVAAIPAAMLLLWSLRTPPIEPIEHPRGA